MLPSPLCPLVGQRLASCGEKQKRRITIARTTFGRSKIASLMILTPVFQGLEKSIGMTPSGENGRKGRLNQKIPASAVARQQLQLRVTNSPGAQARGHAADSLTPFGGEAGTRRNTRRPERSAVRPTRLAHAIQPARYWEDATILPARWQKSGRRIQRTTRQQKTKQE